MAENSSREHQCSAPKNPALEHRLERTKSTETLAVGYRVLNAGWDCLRTSLSELLQALGVADSRAGCEGTSELEIDSRSLRMRYYVRMDCVGRIHVDVAIRPMRNRDASTYDGMSLSPFLSWTFRSENFARERMKIPLNKKFFVLHSVILGVSSKSEGGRLVCA